MITNLFDYLQISADKFPGKTAFTDENSKITYTTLYEKSCLVATMIIEKNVIKKPIVVLMDKTVDGIVAYMGVLGSGNCYCPIDVSMPIERIKKIILTLDPEIVLTEKKYIDMAVQFMSKDKILIIDFDKKIEVNQNAIKGIVNGINDQDIAYILFTSGSTGTPKGVMITHRGVIDLIKWSHDVLNIDETTVFGNQVPLYFSMSVFDIYATIMNAATMHIIPHRLFSQPASLMQYLSKHCINTLVWVPSALSYVSILKALDKPHVSSIRKIIFGGESMPIKQLNRWIEEYPNAQFVNIYGPTEVTDTCTYYVVDRKFDDKEVLPAGYACKNKRILLLDEDNNLIKDTQPGIVGEICVIGSGLAIGYYGDSEKTKEVFVQNPLNLKYREIMYRTGDLGHYNQYGQLVYDSRKDFQIKHKGHRIELAEIETMCLSIDGINNCCSLYDSVKKRIVLIYCGLVTGDVLLVELKKLLPDYMLPSERIKVDTLPVNLNGKIDRELLKKTYIGG